MIPLVQLWDQNDVSTRLVTTDAWSLEDFPDCTAYVASEWKIEGDETPKILLEVHH